MVQKSIVIDIGSRVCRAGFAGDDEPKAEFPCVVAPSGDGGTMVGQDALDKGDPGSLIYPVQHDHVTSIESLQHIWSHVFRQLGVSSQGCHVMLTQAIDESKEIVVQMTKTLFDSFDVAAVFVAKQPVLSLYSMGRKDGMVVQSGSDYTQVVCIQAGFALPATIACREETGSSSGPALANIVHSSIQKAPEDARNDMYAHVILTGGNAKLSEMEARLTKELTALATRPGTKVKVTASPYPTSSAWIGGSLLAKLDNFGPYWVTKQEYKAEGNAVIEKKVFI